MAYTDIDRVNGFTIRKLHSPDKQKTFGYISGIKDAANNLSEINKHTSLTEARKHHGFVAKSKVTLPKSAYAQNQKGYDPHNAKK